MSQTALSPSSSSSNAELNSLTAPLNYIRRQTEKPAFLSAALTGGAAELKFETETHAAMIADMRPLSGGLSVDREGFELLGHTTGVDDLYDDDAVRGPYYAEIEELLKNHLGASRVVIFDATRRAVSKSGAVNPDGRRGPAGRIHVDYTVNSGPQRLADVVGAAEAERLESNGTRVAQINVWRPIRGPVIRSPLALADAASIAPEDLIATDQIFPDRTGEIYHLAYSPSQRWYFAPDMHPDEVLLIKGWDTRDGSTARFTPHTAFDPPAMLTGAAARESIEVRTFVIFE